MRRPAALLLLSVLCFSAAPAQAWELFRSQSSAIERGNEHLSKGEHKEALAAYDEAARELPNDLSVQLDRGLALLSLGKLAEAREAFRRAGAANASKQVRGPALYDLGLAFMQEADAAGKAEDLAGAHKLLEESVDAFRGSLRAQPNNQDAAWNLELAKRRLLDVEQKQAEKKKQEDEQKKDEENKDNKDRQDGDKNDDEQEPQSDAGSPEQGDAGTPKPNQAEGERDAGAPPKRQPEKADAGAPDPSEPEPNEPAKPDPSALPEHMERALDALEAGEENLEKQRAKQRARARPRRIEKDW